MAAGLARPDPDPLCLAPSNLFMSILGAAAGNLVLTVLATGGCYIGGGIRSACCPSRGTGAALPVHLPGKGPPEPAPGARAGSTSSSSRVALLGAALHGLDIDGLSREVSA